MKTDLTRSTFRREKHYSSVRMQQGRVQLDSDWNEQLDIEMHADTTTRIDVIGPCGAPEAAAGFELGVTPDGNDLTTTRWSSRDNNWRPRHNMAPRHRPADRRCAIVDSDSQCATTTGSSAKSTPGRTRSSS